MASRKHARRSLAIAITLFFTPAVALVIFVLDNSPIPHMQEGLLATSFLSLVALQIFAVAGLAVYLANRPRRATQAEE